LRAHLDLVVYLLKSVGGEALDMLLEGEGALVQVLKHEDEFAGVHEKVSNPRLACIRRARNTVLELLDRPLKVK